MRARTFLLLLLTAACGAVPGEDTVDAREEIVGPPADGIVFVHGIAGSGDDWNTMVERFKADGWPAERLIARSYADPAWGCNTSNADELAGWVQELADRGAQRIAIVAHSMGGLSSRYFLQRKDGAASVVVFVTLGTMHHGILSSCLSPIQVCVWQELCLAGPFLADLNNTLESTRGATRWVSIFSPADAIVSADSARLVGVQNIELEGVAHDGPTGLQESARVYEHVKSSL